MALVTDYEMAKALGLTDISRWENGIEHHPLSVRLMDFLKDHDFNDYNDHFCWKTGGDGDNGETLMYQMDAYFETFDHQPLLPPKKIKNNFFKKLLDTYKKIK
jgi:hypothetical protein